VGAEGEGGGRYTLHYTTRHTDGLELTTLARRYLWTHSTAFQSLLDAQARLEAAVASGEASSANAELAEKAKGMAAEKAKDVALLQAKDDEDKAAQVAAAAKLAKKLKKGKKGKK
jgi:hypothetical protein